MLWNVSFKIKVTQVWVILVMFNTYLTLSAITDIFNIIFTVESIDVCPKECFHIEKKKEEIQDIFIWTHNANGIHLYNEYQKFTMYYLSDKGLRFQAMCLTQDTYKQQLWLAPQNDK